MTLIFSSETVKDLHDVVISFRGVKGIKSKGMLESCLERPFTYISGHEVFPGIFRKAGALLHCIAGPFCPFTDGNKRTALLTVGLFLHVNGYSFEFPEDVVDFMLSIAKGKIKSIRRISRWIKQSCAKNQWYGIDEEKLVSMYKTVDFHTIDGWSFPMRLKKV